MTGKQEEQRSSSERTWRKRLKDCLNFIRREHRLTIIKNLKEEEEEEEGSINHNNSNKWAQIGDDVFALILQRLCLTDYLRTQVVCTSWQSNIPRIIVQHFCSPLPELPVVFLQTKHSKYFSIFNLSTKSVSPCPGISAKSCRHCYGTIQGWLIMADEKVSFPTGTCVRSIFFFNPLTKSKVLVPTKLQCEGWVEKIVASAKPSDPNCVVVCLFMNPNKIALNCVSNDKSWTFIKPELVMFNDIEILDGKLYALDRVMPRRPQSYIIVCDLQNRSIKTKLLAAKPPSSPASNRISYDDKFWFLATDASSGELLIIYMFDVLMQYECYCLLSSLSKVFKFKFTDSEEGGEWIEVKNLGNRILFVSQHKSLVVSNIGLHGPQDLIKDNCTYFACDLKNIVKSQPWIGRYCASDEKTDYYACKSLIMPNRLLSPIWFTPSFW